MGFGSVRFTVRGSVREGSHGNTNHGKIGEGLTDLFFRTFSWATW